jgi:integrase/recombinase XerD
MHPTITAFLDHLRLAGRATTAASYGFHLAKVDQWLAAKALTPLTVTTDDLRAYQRHLAEDHRGPSGRLLAKTTQAARLAVMKSFWSWLHRRGERVGNPAADLQLPRIPVNPVRRDHLTIQEVTAVLQTLAAQASAFPEGCHRWALAVRDLALLTVAIASGRRRGGLRDLTLAQLDLAKAEVRVEREKGQTGRVLPIAAWAIVVLRSYVERARPILCWQRDNPYLFVGDDGPQLGANTLAAIIERAHAVTVAANPDLTELTEKRLTPHSLRVTFASLLFQGGASIRTINELMLHQQLGVTARYVPVDLDDLRRACATAHPRA